MISGRSVVTRLGSRPSVTYPVLGLTLGAAFVLVPLAIADRLRRRGSAEIVLTAPDIALTVVTALALTQVRRFPRAVLVVTGASVMVSMVGGWQVNLAQLGVTFAMLGYALTQPRARAIRAAGVGSVLLGATSLLTAALRTGEWGRLDVVLWLWLATAVALAIEGRRATMAALTDRALRAEESREETARRRVAEDRVRIARELHDVIAHHVAVISVQSGVAEHLVDRDPAGARAALHHVRGSARSVLAELQSVLGVLRQDETALPTAPAPGLAEIDDLVATARSLGTPVEVDAPATAPPLSLATGSAAYRLVQEALTNVHKHATGAPTVVRIAPEGDHLHLAVVNAAPPRTSAAHVAGTPVADSIGSALGLVGMRERILACGGTLDVGPTPEGGFRVAARLPLVQEDP